MQYTIQMTYNVTDTLNFESDNKSGIKYVYNKWNTTEVVFNDGEELELKGVEFYPDELHDFKRPDYIAVYDDTQPNPVYRSK